MKVYSVADNIISPLGFNTDRNYNALLNLESGISHINDRELYPESFYGACINRRRITESFSPEQNNFTWLEKMLILSIQDTLSTVQDINKENLLLVISTTKGNIDLLADQNKSNVRANRVGITEMAKTINDYFKFSNAPLVVSNACISGISALLTGSKMIKSGLYDHVLVAGGDLLSEFVVSGFQCLKAISDQPCKPYDVNRTGVSLGEACGSMLLSKDPGLCGQPNALSVLVSGGQSNDANHISGPSRTGRGLKIAVQNALRNGGLDIEAIGYINAHGTATLFNDEMEAIAFNDLGMGNIPLNSLKGYFGHTLGAAGIIETIMTVRQLNNDFLIKSAGIEQLGVSRDIKVLRQNLKAKPIQYAIKTASGFGGCNAAIIIEKDGAAHTSI